MAMFLAIVIAVISWCPAAKTSGKKCPVECDCYTSQTSADNVVNCSSGNIIHIPPELPPDTHQLYVERCRIAGIKWNSLPALRSLRKLVLSRCHLKRVNFARANFDAITPNLDTLDLRHNHLVEFSPDTAWQSVQTLLLSYNKIKHVQDVHLANLPNLAESVLSNNVINAISNDSCMGSNGSREMVLRKLVLNANQISHVGDGAFSSLSSLQRLELADNRLTTINGSWFIGLNNLQYLILRGNALQHVSDDSFRSLGSLLYLDLSDNRLMDFPRGLPMLEWFDVSINRIRHANERLQTDLYPIEEVNFANNPLHCDCELLWLKELYDSREHLMPSDARFIPTCSSPPALAGDSWDALADAMFKCEEVSADTNVDASGEKELTVRTGYVTDTSIEVVWRSKGYLFVRVQYYVFGLREATHRHVRLAAAQRQVTLRRLRPGTNYVVCVVPSSLTDQTDSFLQPLSLQHCAEVSTKDSPTVMAPLDFENLASCYICAMLVTCACVLVIIGAAALLYGIVSSAQGTAPDRLKSHQE